MNILLWIGYLRFEPVVDSLATSLKFCELDPKMHRIRKIRWFLSSWTVTNNYNKTTVVGSYINTMRTTLLFKFFCFFELQSYKQSKKSLFNWQILFCIHAVQQLHINKNLNQKSSSSYWYNHLVHLLNPTPWKNPRTLGSSPIIGLWSGVKLSGPHTVLFIPV